jgi:chitinase
MVLRFVAGALALAVASGASAQAVFADGFEDPTVWVLGYYVGYERALLPPNEIDFAGLTHLMVGRVVPNANGTLDKTFDIDAVNGPIFAQQASAAAHGAGRKAILMVGGAGATGWTSAASAANRATFVANLLQAMDQFGMDGLDLDWEPLVTTTDRNELLALAQDLRTARPSMLLTIPIIWINRNINPPTSYYGTIAPYFDRVNLMTYDMNFYGAGSGWLSWFTSALDGETPSTPSSVDDGISFLLESGAPAAKLGIGIPFYGNCWQGVTAPRQDTTNAAVIYSDGAMSYANIMASHYSPARYTFDAIAQEGWLGAAVGFGPHACTFVTYEDAASIAAKGAYVKSHGLGGTIIWTIAQGHIAGNPVGARDPLLEAIRTSFF